MNKKPLKILIVVFWFISVIIAYIIGTLMEGLNTAFEPVVQTTPIIVNGHTKAYMKKRMWGLAGNHSEIFLTVSRDSDRADTLKDVVFEHAETLFYQTVGDTLKIYSPDHYEINPNFYSDLTIQLIPMDSRSFMSLYDQVHRQLKCTDWMY